MTVQDHRIGDIGRRQKIRNVTQGILLVVAMLGQAILLAWLLFGTEALPWVLAAGVLVGILRPRVPSRWVLTMYGAQPIPYSLAPRLHRMVDALAERAALPTPPTVYYLPTGKANAFAAGRSSDAVLGITDGLLRRLDTRELAGVLAHEISHIRNGDTTIMSLSDLIGRFVQGLSYLGLWSVILTLPLTLSQDDPTPLLRTHPATADRVRRLRQLTPDEQQSPLGSHEPAAPPTYPEITRPPRLHFPGIRW